MNELIGIAVLVACSLIFAYWSTNFFIRRNEILTVRQYRLGYNICDHASHARNTEMRSNKLDRLIQDQAAPETLLHRTW